MPVALAPGQSGTEALSTTREILFTTTRDASATNPESYTISNPSAIAVTLGGATVTAGNGIVIPAGGTLTLPYSFPNIDVYAIAASGTPTVGVYRSSGVTPSTYGLTQLRDGQPVSAAGAALLAAPNAAAQLALLGVTSPTATGESLWVDGKGLSAGSLTSQTIVAGTWTRDTADYPDAGGAGSSFSTSSANAQLWGPQIPIDQVRYEVRASIKGASLCYVGVNLVDVIGTGVQNHNSIEGRFPGSALTTLAAPLNPGDTTVTLTDATGWPDAAHPLPSDRNLAFWPFVDGGGKTWGNYTFTRTVSLNYTARSGNVITLGAAWAGAAIPAGSAVACLRQSGTFIYAISGVTPSASVWTDYSGILDFSLPTFGVGFRTGAVAARPIILANFSTPVTQRFANLTIRRI